MAWLGLSPLNRGGLRRHGALGLLVAFVAATRLAGIDFGDHWDERTQFIEPLARAAATGGVLPGKYYYGSLIFDLGLASLAGDALAYAASTAGGRGAEPLGVHLERKVLGPAFLLRMRSMTALLSLTSLVWIYLLVLRWRGDRIEALFASAALGLSWEVGYHMRWLSSDTLLMALASLTMLLLLRSYDEGMSAKWLGAAAVAAGLACATKYTGGVLLLPILIVVGLSHARCPDLGRDPRLFIGVLALWAGVFLATTPGLLFDSGIFMKHAFYLSKAYNLDYGGYNVDSHFRYLRLAAGYLLLAVPSPYLAVSVVLSGFGLLGLFDLIAGEKRKAILFLSFPSVYLFVFALHQVLLVRNMMVLVPFAAVLWARGFGVARRALPAGWRAAFAAGAALCLSANALWSVREAASIVDRERDRLPALAAYIDANPKTAYLLSTRVARGLRALGGPQRANVTGDPRRPADQAVLFSSEVPDWTSWKANRFDYTTRVFGSYEVNFNYYPSWIGPERIVVLPAPSARSLGVAWRNEP